ncbi:hypothetical protein GDO86_013167 [Hymenochirus boettgeri]|uniref:RHD domain-containing protein n=1 Tax=Hymenochirus boettgeri TaxID=247094 RepID=A0A8T2IXE0_9PIPI|nr:hypothetical protein GDO86_013167 [Hymenochirus boettgeri]
MSSLKIEHFDPYSYNGVEDLNGVIYPSAILDNRVTGQDLSNKPCLSIIEQPKQRGFRFRYVCEGPSHGGLPGASSEKGKKTYPTVKIFNYVGMAKIEVDLVTHTDPPRAHAHSLVGKNCNEMGCITTVGPDDMTAQFSNLGIVHVTKKSQTEILKEKMRRHILRTSVKNKLTGEEERKIEQEVKDLKKVTDLSIVRLRFTAYLPDSNGAYTLPLPPVISHPIHDSKSPGASNLRISRMDKTAGSVKGGDEVYLLCDKVQKDDIEIRFYEDDENGWQAFGNFAPTDVHKQYAIVFRTPPYHTQEIDRPVTVFLQLKRKKGGDVSDSRQFTYYPLDQDKEEIERKRRKDLPTLNNHFFGGGSPMGGAGGGSSFGQGGGGNINYSYSGMHTGYYMTAPSSGVYHGTGHVMKHCSPTHPTDKKQHQPSINIKKEEKGDSACSQTESSASAHREAQYQMMAHQANICNMRMLSLAQRTSRALLDFAITADPRMMLAVQRHLTVTQDENGDTPLHLAIIHEQVTVFQQLVQVILSIPNQQILNMSNHLQQTPLHLGVITKQYEVVAFLLKAGADPTILDRYGNSVLHLAVQAKDEKMLSVLLKHPSVCQSNVLNTPDYHGLCPVHWCVKMKHEKCLELLVKGGANVNGAERKSGRSPLHIAVEMDNLNMATFLVKKLGADVNAKTFGGNTSLHLAASRGSPVLTRLLVNEGANVLSENDEPVNSLQTCGSTDSESDSDVQMDIDSDQQGDSDTGSATMDSDSELNREEMKIEGGLVSRSHCAAKRRYPGHTPLDLTKSQKVRDILSKHTTGNTARKTKGSELANVLSLETNTVQCLEKLLNEGQTGADWTELASRLSLQSLVETYKNTSSPTESLLRSYELAGGSVKELINTLASMGLNEGVELLWKSETYSKHQIPESKNDSAYESLSHQSTELEQCSENVKEDPQSHKRTFPISAAGLLPATESTSEQ